MQALREKEKGSEDLKGTWKFEPLENGSSKAIFVVHADAGESLPVRVAHSKVEKGLPKALESIRTLAENLEQEQP